MGSCRERRLVSMRKKGLGEPSTREGSTEGHSFDDLARGLATGTISRGQALKLVGSTVLDAALMPLFPDTAQALTRSQRRKCRRGGGTVCGEERSSEMLDPTNLDERGKQRVHLAELAAPIPKQRG